MTIVVESWRLKPLLHRAGLKLSEALSDCGATLYIWGNKHSMILVPFYVSEALSTQRF